MQSSSKARPFRSMGASWKLWFVLLLSGIVACPSVRAEETIDVAGIYALTGVAKASNATSLIGVRLAVDEINRSGGILNKPLRLLVFDNNSTPIGSAAAVEQADGANVVAILGSVWSSHSLAAARVAQERGIPMITNYSTSPAVTAVGDHIFRVCYTDNLQGKIMAAFARSDLKAGTAAVFVNLNSDFSLGLAEVFRRELERLGGKVVLELEYKLKQEDFGPLVRRVQAAQPDVVFLSGHDESGVIARRLQEAEVPSIPMGGDGWSEPSFLDSGGTSIKRGYYSSHWTESSRTEKARAFVHKYSREGDLGAGAALGYDAVMLLSDAIRRAGAPERGRIRAALQETRAFEGVTGHMDFSSGRDPVKAAVIMEIVNGSPRYLKTVQPLPE
ncbi:MAG: ABC transporter substrate-binding protein [Syntrophobacteraceae bacterium]|nr:ABC transporter substrate-binding protein [Syntrophobacteraceae bacterium]